MLKPGLLLPNNGIEYIDFLATDQNHKVNTDIMVFAEHECMIWTKGSQSEFLAYILEWAHCNCEHNNFHAFLYCYARQLTLKVLNFWKLTSYCSLKPLRSGMVEVVPARTLPTLHPPSPPTVHQLSRLALEKLTNLSNPSSLNWLEMFCLLTSGLSLNIQYHIWSVSILC